MSAALPAYTSRGDGDTAVVMLHGVGGSSAAWAPQLDAFAAAGYRAVAWDAPGYGASATIDPYDIAGLAAALARLLDRLAAARVVLLGHSMGGMVAQEALARYPARIHGVVLSATTAAFGKPDGDWQRAFLAERLGPLDAGRTMGELASGLVAGFVGPAAEPAGVRRAIELMAAVPAPTYRAALRAIAGFDRRAELGAVRVPALLVAGERDPVAPPAVMRRMAERMPNATAVVLAGCGHLANLERPAAFDAAVLGWLAEHFPSHRRP
jgi:pimeloyl-ACP methyl ester carboxylesterase